MGVFEKLKLFARVEDTLSDWMRVLNYNFGLASKVESSATNGNIKIDNTEATVYTHPDNHSWSMINETPTTLSGYGITDAYTETEVDNRLLHSMARQAIINGNFDVWQRGTSFTMTTSGYAADRWFINRSQNVVISRQDASLDYSRYCLRFQRQSGETWTSTQYLIYSGLESNDGIKLRNKKITLSFKARAGANYSPTNGALTFAVKTGTGSDENFTSTASYATGSATVISQTATLTTEWQTFSYTTVSALGSTVTQLGIYFTMTPTGTAGAADYFEIAQVQVCAGDVALPFQPKSFDEELRLCLRYYEKTFDYSSAPGTTSLNGSICFQTRTAIAASTASYLYPGEIRFKEEKCKVPAVTFYSPATGTANAVRVSGVGNRTGISGASIGTNGVCYIAVDNTSTTAIALDNVIILHYIADSEL